MRIYLIRALAIVMTYLSIGQVAFTATPVPPPYPGVVANRGEIVNGNLCVGDIVPSDASHYWLDIASAGTQDAQIRIGHYNSTLPKNVGILFYKYIDTTTAYKIYYGFRNNNPYTYFCAGNITFGPSSYSQPVNGIKPMTQTAIGPDASPSDYTLEIEGTVHSSCGYFDSTPWPRRSPEEALNALMPVKGKYVDLLGDGTEITYVLDHSTLPNDLRKISTYVKQIKGDELDFRDKAVREQLQIVGDITISQNKDPLTQKEAMYSSALVKGEGRDIGGNISYCVLAIQGLKDIADKANGRLEKIESTVNNGLMASNASGTLPLNIGKLNESAAGRNAVLLGDSNDVVGTDSLVLSGSGNVIKGDKTIIIGGDLNQIYGDNNLVHGSQNICNSQGVTVFGSAYMTSGTANSFVFGDATTSSCLLTESNGFYVYPDDPKGKLLIGAKSVEPGTKLKVEGGDVRITGGDLILNGKSVSVPDYVFEPAYKLMSISDLNKYIQEHKKLPNVPSAKEIEAKGMNVSEFQLKLLEQVESLNLYVIQQDKQLKEQNKLLQEQAKVIEQLKHRLESK